jgi:UDP-galactopyranose mutase
MEPFYPVNDALNMEIYNKYSILAEQESNVIFGGRLAEYKYYDMAPLIACAMSIAKEEGL